jgi:lysyl-tRNA synthetase class 2
LQSGLPECSGVALGIDRLIMLALDVDTIDDVIAFPVNRA